MAAAGLPLSENDRRLYALRDCHRGKKAVVIGMGPSLRVEDLERFQGFVSFACNKIYLAYDKTDWRPDFYAVNDILVAENNREEISRISDPVVLFPAYLRRFFREMGNAIFLPTYLSMVRLSKKPHYRSNPVDGIVSGGGTVLMILIQAAYWAGCSEVYLVGVDFSFQKTGPVQGRTSLGEDVLISQGERNHFVSNYRNPGECWSAPRMDQQVLGFNFARRAFERDGRKLINASRTSKLEALERVEFDNVFPHPGNAVNP